MIKPSVQNKIVLIVFTLAIVGIFFPMFSNNGNDTKNLVAKPSEVLPGSGTEMIVESKGKQEE